MISRWKIALHGVLAASLPAVAASQVSITPDPGSAGQPLALQATLPVMSCLYDVVAQSIEPMAGGVRVRYTVQPVPNALCFTVMPPLTVDATIGPFEAGEYLAEVVGTIGGIPSAPQSAGFSVRAAQAPADAAVVPALSPWSVALLALALLMLGSRARRACFGDGAARSEG